MDTRMSIMCGGLRFLIATSVALTLLMAVAATSAAAASPTSCLVQNAATGRNYTSLQDAVDAAHRGDRLQVRGLCRGRTVIHKDIGITGRSDTASSRKPILTGPDRTDRPTAVLSVRAGARVHVRTLRIEGPDEDICGPRGQGLRNSGDLTLIDVRVRRLCRVGGNVRGVVNEGVLVLNGASRIGNNGWNVNRGSLTLNDESGIDGFDDVVNRGTLTFNDHSRFVGLVTRDGVSVSGSLDNYGRLILNDRSRISDHELTAVWNSGTFTMNDDSRVSHNGDFRYEVAPAVINTGRLTLNGTSHISDNWMGVENSGSITLNGSSSIRDNHRTQYRSSCPHWCPPTPPLVGAGVSNKGSLTLNDSSSITANSAAESGAGVYLWEGTGASLTMTGSSTISGNTTGTTGGGIYVGTGSTLSGVSCGPQTLANIYGNTPDDCYLSP